MCAEAITVGQERNTKESIMDVVYNMWYYFGWYFILYK